MGLNVHGDRYHWWVLVTVVTGVFMSTLDASIVNIALPSIMAYFNTSLAVVEWVVLSYLLVITSLLLPFGRLADIAGRKKLYRLGFVIFALGSGLCALSPSAELLVAFRVLQAVGAAMLMSNSFAIITITMPPGQRGRALGIQGAVVATGFTVGPTLGGFLISSLGWRSIFYVNVPIGIIGTLMATIVLDERLVSPAISHRRSFDFFGAALVIIGLTGLLLGMTTGQAGDWTLPQVRLELGIAVLAFVLFLFWESRIAEPLMELKLFKNRLFSLGNFSALLAFLGISANVLLMPFFLQLALGYSPLQAGLLMTPTALTLALVAPFSGWLSDRLGARVLSSLGLAVGAFALAWISTIGPDAGYGDIVSRLVLLGVGQGLFQPPNSSSVMGAVPRRNLGIAGGFLSMMRNTGQVLGTALAGTILATALVAALGHASLDALQSGASSPYRDGILAAFMVGMRRAYLVSASICAIGVFTSLVRGKPVRQETDQLPGPG